MFNDNPFRYIKTNPILPITEGADKASKQAEAKAEGHMIRLYGKGRVTHSSHSGGHFVEHESKDGDTHGHTFNPETGKISKTPHVTSSYYGESVTNPILPITEGAVDKAADHFDVEVSADGKTWQHHSGKGPKYTSDELIQKYSEHLKEKKPRGSADNAYAGLNPTGVGTPEGSNDRFENTDLFPKNWQINLREHIRNEYSNRGYDATTVEVQETYNHVVSMLNERNQANKEASRVAEIERGRKVLGRKRVGSASVAISAARNSKAGLDPENYFTRRSAHKTKRGEKTKISPSSPAREISDIERKTRQGT